MKNFFSRFFRAVEEHPDRALLCYMAASVVIWTLQCSLLQNVLSLDALEAIAWGEEFAWGSAKHPPLSGWLAELFSLLARRADWGSYLACQLMLVTGVWFVYRTSRLFLDRYAAVLSATLLYFLTYYLPSWMKFSTYFVEIALVPIAAYCFFSAVEKRKLRFWVLFGVTCALGLLNKYSFGLQIIGFAILMFAIPAYRKQLRGFGPYLAALLAIVLLIPHLHWLFEHDFLCLRHISDRMNEEHNWFDPLVLLGLIVYPLVTAAAVLFLANLPGWRSAERETPDKGLFVKALVLTLVPGVFYLALDLTGNAVITMWLCTAASWTGLAAVALFPYRVTPGLWRRVFVLLLFVTAAVFAGTTLDLLFSTSKRLHMHPEALIGPVRAFWREHRRDEIPVVYGGRWYAGVIMNYTPERPPVVEAGIPDQFHHLRERIETRGVLLIGKAKELEEFAELTGYQVKFRKLSVVSKAPFGEEEESRFLVGYYPPRAERKETDRNRKEQKLR